MTETLESWKMRALAAEALLAERDAKIEEMDETIEELLADLSNKPKPEEPEAAAFKGIEEYSKAATELERRMMEDMAFIAGSKWKDKPLPKTSDKKGPKLKKWEAQIPQTPPTIRKKSDPPPQDVREVRETAHPIEMFVEHLMYEDRVKFELRVKGESFCYVLERVDVQHRGAIERATYEILMAAADKLGIREPNADIVMQLADEFRRRMG